MSQETPSSARNSVLPPVENQRAITAPQGSFFESSRNLQISGGHFTSTRGHHTNLTINFNQTESDNVVDVPNSDAAGSSFRIPDHNSSGQPQQYQTTVQPDNIHWIDSPSLPVQKSSEQYHRHLATKRRGSPLWVPEPNNMLPVEYQKKGISIGDVGIITDYGGFDFLFNICASAEDPVNPEQMPEDFSPLHPPLGPMDIRGYSEYKPDSFITSRSVAISQRDGSSGVTFESSAIEGAILAMPKGSNSKDLANTPRFKKYAATNAEKWYKYVNEVRGREARNGDLRLVVGYDTTSTWGMATFLNLHQRNAFRLDFKPTGENSLGRTYGWEYSGMAEAKAGPDVQEVENLRNLDQAAGSAVYENQCLFVRTINITLRDDVWNKLTAESEMFYLEEVDKAQPAHKESLPRFGLQGGGNTSFNNPFVGGRGGVTDVLADDEDISLFQQETSPSVRLSDVPRALDGHPSKVVNELLLKENPNAKVAITEDNDWISVLEKKDGVLPDSKTLFSRMLVIYDVFEEDNAVSLQLKKSGADKPHPSLADVFRSEARLRNLSKDGLKMPPKLGDLDVLTPLKSSWAMYYQEHSSTSAKDAPIEDPSSVPETAVSSTLPKLGTVVRSDLVGTFESLEEFFAYFSWIKPPSRLKKDTGYAIFKSVITPLWDDPTNVNGGKWVLLFRENTDLLDDCWRKLCFAVMTDELDTWDEICGAVVSFDQRDHHIQFWTKSEHDAEKLNSLGKHIIAILGIGRANNVTFGYQLNSAGRSTYCSIIPVSTPPHRPSLFPPLLPLFRLTSSPQRLPTLDPRLHRSSLNTEESYADPSNTSSPNFIY